MDEEIKGFKEQKVRENKASAQGSLPVLTELEQVLKGEGRAHASAGSLGNRQGRGLQTQREGEPPELSLNVQGELDSQVRWSKDQREETRAGRTRSQAVWVRETQGVREGSPWWGCLRMASSVRPCQGPRGIVCKRPRGQGVGAPVCGHLILKVHLRWPWFMSQNRNHLLVDERKEKDRKET